MQPPTAAAVAVAQAIQWMTDDEIAHGDPSGRRRCVRTWRSWSAAVLAAR